jgi:hypothetical protein
MQEFQRLELASCPFCGPQLKAALSVAACRCFLRAPSSPHDLPRSPRLGAGGTAPGQTGTVQARSWIPRHRPANGARQFERRCPLGQNTDGGSSA